MDFLIERDPDGTPRRLLCYATKKVDCQECRGLGYRRGGLFPDKHPIKRRCWGCAGTGKVVVPA